MADKDSSINFNVFVKHDIDASNDRECKHSITECKCIGRMVMSLR